MTTHKPHGRPRLHPNTTAMTKRRTGDQRRYYALSLTDPVLSWAKLAFQNARVRARKKGLAFTITLQDVVTIARTTTHCPIFGVELEFERGRGDGPRPFAASIDRIDNSDGYHPKTIRLISQRANSLKGSLSIEELLQIGLYAADMLAEAAD